MLKNVELQLILRNETSFFTAFYCVVIFLLTVFGDLRGHLHGEVRGIIPVELCQEILSPVVGTWACLQHMSKRKK